MKRRRKPDGNGALLGPSEVGRAWMVAVRVGMGRVLVTKLDEGL